jgi:hypothetical protein
LLMHWLRVISCSGVTAARKLRNISVDDVVPGFVG